MESLGKRLRIALNYLKHNKRLVARQSFNVAVHTLEMRTKPMHSHACPYTIFIEPTIKCNLRCPMCDWVGRNRGSPDMTLGQFEEILDKLPLVAHIHLEGLGEPFMHKDFLKMVRLAVDRGVSVDTTSNCTLLNERLVSELMDSGLWRLFISVDGASAKTYEAIRVGASFDRLMVNLQLLSWAKMNSRGPLEMSLWFVGNQSNIQELPYMVEMASRFGIPVVYADATHDWGKEAVRGRIQSSELQGFQSLTKTCVDYAMIRAKELGVELRLNSMIAPIVDNNAVGCGCQWPWWSFYVTVEGYIMPCCLRPDPQVFHFGSILENDFEAIWNSPAYMVFRSDLKRGLVPDLCKGCSTLC